MSVEPYGNTWNIKMFTVMKIGFPPVTGISKVRFVDRVQQADYEDI
jgi:hypothetical protein